MNQVFVAHTVIGGTSLVRLSPLATLGVRPRHSWTSSVGRTISGFLDGLAYACYACMHDFIAASEEPAIATTMRIAKSREREREGTHDNYYMYRLYVDLVDLATSTLDSHSANSCTACSITVYLGNPPVPVLFRVFKFAAL